VGRGGGGDFNLVYRIDAASVEQYALCQRGLPRVYVGGNAYVAVLCQLFLYWRHWLRLSCTEPPVVCRHTPVGIIDLDFLSYVSFYRDALCSEASVPSNPGFEWAR
jgi:hypothetical protein